MPEDERQYKIAGQHRVPVTTRQKIIVGWRGFVGEGFSLFCCCECRFMTANATACYKERSDQSLYRKNKPAFAAYQIQKVLENDEPLKHWTRLRKHWYVGRRSNQTFICSDADKVYWHRKITKNKHTWKKRNFYQASSLRRLIHRH